MKSGFDSSGAIDDLSHMLQLFKHKTLYIQKLLFSYVHQYFDQSNTDEAKEYLGVLFHEEEALIEKYRDNNCQSLKMYFWANPGSSTASSAE